MWNCFVIGSMTRTRAVLVSRRILIFHALPNAYQNILCNTPCQVQCKQRRSGKQIVPKSFSTLKPDLLTCVQHDRGFSESLVAPSYLCLTIGRERTRFGMDSIHRDSQSNRSFSVPSTMHSSAPPTGPWDTLCRQTAMIRLV